MAHQPKSTGEHTTPETLQSLLISQGEKSLDSVTAVGTSTPVQTGLAGARPAYKTCGTDVKTFKALQALVVPTINNWANTTEAPSDAFHQIWLKNWRGFYLYLYYLHGSQKATSY